MAAPVAAAAAGGMNPLIGGALLLGGSSLLESIFGKEDPMLRYRKQGAQHLQGMLGKDAVNIDELIARNRAAMIPRASEYGETINKRFGFDTGRGQSALMEMLLRGEQDFNLKQAPQYAMANAQHQSALGRALMGA